MLSEQSTPIVRATLPAVGAAIDEIATVFYRRLFAAHPDLLRDLFNRGNQANGQQRQALAGSIAAFAGMLLDHPDARPDAMLARIAHKHASLGVTADQYKIVNEHLLAAISDVLGEAVTPQVAHAWDEVYWLMANALIALEARLYAEHGTSEGGTWRPMTVVARHEETPDALALTLRPADGTPAPTFRPGQYVSVQVELPDGARQIRQYSLSSAPGRPDWRITVKRVRAADGPAGEVSSWLHEQARVGDVLTVSAPFGDLTLPDGDGPLLLASAGIGGTPMLAMLNHLVAIGSSRPVVVVHADRTPADHAHRDELHALVDELPQAALHLWYEDPGHAVPAPAPSSRVTVSAGRADISALPLPSDVTSYLCGPLPFMRTLRGALLGRGLKPQTIHYEVFGPDLWLGQS
ncbi:globin domain-containing protein [Streptomyces albulus]|uniref:globin domain-containing protein n=1 Tax=Streptomyces noursei TaxID=1971 RepID=UPI001F42885F|nr:globin domain-containing protein [Streptomyces noursei]MCE4942022.1 globin domain-containing protein [Streptomyces noursei]